MQRASASIFSLLITGCCMAQALTPEITSWKINTDSSTGYNNILSNVLSVNYTSTDVYISCNSVPDYTVGPWSGNPNVPLAQGYTFKITRNPQVQSGTQTKTGLGHIGVWSNGVSIFNAKDARSYNNAGVWNQDAYRIEGPSFDNCNGHPSPTGEYHLHISPVCLYDETDKTVHAPIIGYSFDGYPVYGAYGFANTDGTGGIRRMHTGYRKRNITTRTTLPDGTTAASVGPAVSTQYALGYYVEDYEYISGIADLDSNNGRFCVTPDYPQGTYAYFVTVDSFLFPEYPYTFGPAYHGVVTVGNLGPQGGKNTVPGSATAYVPDSIATGVEETSPNGFPASLFPNPAKENLFVNIEQAQNAQGEKLNLLILNSCGQIVHQSATEMQSLLSIQVSEMPTGIYLLVLETEKGNKQYKRFLKE
jgi:hypothetical protein